MEDLFMRKNFRELLTLIYLHVRTLDNSSFNVQIVNTVFLCTKSFDGSQNVILISITFHELLTMIFFAWSFSELLMH